MAGPTNFNDYIKHLIGNNDAALFRDFIVNEEMYRRVAIGPLGYAGVFLNTTRRSITSHRLRDEIDFRDELT